MNQFHDAYSTLGLKPGSPKDEVAARIRRLLKAWDPDKFTSVEEKKEAEDELEKITDASNLLLSHFDSDEHDENNCECMQGKLTTKKRRTQHNNTDEERDRMFSARLEGGERRSKRQSHHDAAEPTQKRFPNEKALNFILLAVAAVCLLFEFLTTMGPSKAPNPAQQLMAPQAPQAGQNPQQNSNPLQQILRSTGEQSPQGAEGQSQQEAPQQEAPQE